MAQIDSIQAVIARLGGTVAAARRLGLGKTVINNWHARGRIPATHYLSVNRALVEDVGDQAAPEIFGFRIPGTLRTVPGGKDG